MFRPNRHTLLYDDKGARLRLFLVHKVQSPGVLDMHCVAAVMYTTNRRRGSDSTRHRRSTAKYAINVSASLVRLAVFEFDYSQKISENTSKPPRAIRFHKTSAFRFNC